MLLSETDDDGFGLGRRWHDVEELLSAAESKHI